MNKKRIIGILLAWTLIFVSALYQKRNVINEEMLSSKVDKPRKEDALIEVKTNFEMEINQDKSLMELSIKRVVGEDASEAGGHEVENKRLQEETGELAVPEPTAIKPEKLPITVDWIETKEEYEAARHKSNGKLEVSVSRASKSITNEEGAVLANIYYDKPVVSGDSEAARKINYFFEKEEQEWFDGGGRNTLYNDDNYTIFYDQFCSLCAALGEDSMIDQPPCYTISTRIVLLDLDILSVVQVAHFFTGHNYHYYYGSTFDVKSGELIPIDELASVDADGFKMIIEDIFPEDEIYDEVGEGNYVIHYYGDEIAMNYEYFYDGKSFYIILNRNKQLEDGLIIEWNGKWGNDYEAEAFQYWEQSGSELLQKEK